ncbi:MAG: signal peptidase I, partial [Microbacterium sp.]
LRADEPHHDGHRRDHDGEAARGRRVRERLLPRPARPSGRQHLPVEVGDGLVRLPGRPGRPGAVTGGVRGIGPGIVDRALGVVLSITAVLGTICIAATVGAVVLDVRPLVVTSGSMAPSIDTGALVLVRTIDAHDVAVGDVVSVVGRDGARVTHRVQSATRVDGGRVSLVLKGDANDVPDAEPYVVTTADEAIADAPRLGYLVAWLSGRAGVVLGGLALVLALLVLVGPRRSAADEDDERTPSHRADPRDRTRSS